MTADELARLAPGASDAEAAALAQRLVTENGFDRAAALRIVFEARGAAARPTGGREIVLSIPSRFGL